MVLCHQQALCWLKNKASIMNDFQKHFVDLLPYFKLTCHISREPHCQGMFAVMLNRYFVINSLRPSDAYMRSSSLVQIMACRLVDAKPLSEPLLYNCQLDLWEQTSVKLYLKFKHFHSRKCIWKCRLENISHFASAQCVMANEPIQDHNQ